jgi:hypothetical protein
VLWAFPWGEPGTDLEHETGPDDWQTGVLTDIGDELRAGGDLGAVVLQAVRSGHGVGKSALVAWVILWAIATFELTRGRVTAMTETQLRTITWAEVAKWHGMFIARELFVWHATSLKAADERMSAVWRIDAVPWSKSNPASFAGLHNKRRRTLIVFDEASEIERIIWETAQGATMDAETQIIWLAFGNPTQPTGPFAECFGSKSRWKTRSIDSRTSRFSNKRLIQEWIDEYGEDSDFVRVRVRGLPPRLGINTFIPEDLVLDARRRDLPPSAWQVWPKTMGIDPARDGDDLSVITLRQGPKVLFQRRFSGLDGPDLAAQAVDIWRQHADMTLCAVDAIGIGASCVDALKRVPGFPLMPVNVALPAADDTLYANIRMELWAKGKEWLKSAAIPDDDDLAEELCALKYGFDGKSRFQLESKKDVKKADRLGRSPDRADSLMLTFIGETVAKRPLQRAAKAIPVDRGQRKRVVWSR